MAPRGRPAGLSKPRRTPRARTDGVQGQGVFHGHQLIEHHDCITQLTARNSLITLAAARPRPQSHIAAPGTQQAPNQVRTTREKECSTHHRQKQHVLSSCIAAVPSFHQQLCCRCQRPAPVQPASSMAAGGGAYGLRTWPRVQGVPRYTRTQASRAAGCDAATSYHGCPRPCQAVGPWLCGPHHKPHAVPLPYVRPARRESCGVCRCV